MCRVQRNSLNRQGGNQGMCSASPVRTKGVQYDKEEDSAVFLCASWLNPASDICVLSDYTEYNIQCAGLGSFLRHKGIYRTE